MIRWPSRQRRVASRRELPRWKKYVLSLAGIVFVIALWEIASRAGWVNPLIASSPTRVVQAARDLERKGVLFPALGSTARLFAIGFGLSVLVGLPIGMLIGWYRWLDAVLDPWVSILYAAPRIALIPLIIVWFGFGLEAQVVVVFAIAVFPIIVSTASGISSIDRDYLTLARSFLGTNNDVLRTVALPGSIPAIVSGLRQGMVQALIGVVVAEYFIGATGVGGLIFTAGISFQTGQAFFGALVFSVAALLMTGALRTIERRLDRWRG